MFIIISFDGIGERERGRERGRDCVYMCVHVYACVCLSAPACVCLSARAFLFGARARVYVCAACMHVLRERESVCVCNVRMMVGVDERVDD